MPRRKQNNPELQNCGIDLAQLAQIETLEHLREQSKYLMTAQDPQITVQVDGKAIRLVGEAARTLGIGMQMVLMEIGYQAYDPWMEN